MRFFRSGKASDTFAERITEGHVKGSKLSSEISRKSSFYMNYPDRSVPEEFHKNCIGYFDEVDFYLAVGYDESSDFVHHLHEESESEGLFNWTDSNGDSPAKIVDKQLILVDYLLELGYDLLTPERDNVSESPGFEKYIYSKYIEKLLDF